MTSLAFAWRRLTRQPGRAVLGVLGVAAVGALLFDMVLRSPPGSTAWVTTCG